MTFGQAGCNRRNWKMALVVAQDACNNAHSLEGVSGI